MQVYDLIMLVVLVSAALFGAWKGMAWQLASVTSIVLSYIVAVQFRDSMAGHIDAPPPWNRFLAMLLLYAGTSLAVWVAFRMIAGTIEKAKLKSFDSQMGALVGIAKGILLCVVITLFAVRLLGESERRVIINSNSGYYIAQLLNRSKAILPEEISKVIDPYVHNLDERLDDTPPPIPDLLNSPTAGGLKNWLPSTAGQSQDSNAGPNTNQGREPFPWLPSNRNTPPNSGSNLPADFTPLPPNHGQAERPETAGWR